MNSAALGTGLSLHSRVAGLAPGVPDIVRNLPPLPLACLRVLELAQASDAEPGDLVDTIGSDPRMAMKTLRVANSAAVDDQDHCGRHPRPAYLVDRRRIGIVTLFSV